MKMKDGNITGEEQKIEREDKICSLPPPTLRRFATLPFGSYNRAYLDSCLMALTQTQH